MQHLQNGLVALGLVSARWLWKIGDNHLVVAYGAELDRIDAMTMTSFVPTPVMRIDVKGRSTCVAATLRRVDGFHLFGGLEETGSPLWGTASARTA